MKKIAPIPGSEGPAGQRPTTLEERIGRWEKKVCGCPFSKVPGQGSEGPEGEKGVSIR